MERMWLSTLQLILILTSTYSTCYYSDILGNGTTSLQTEQCNILCPGNATEFCGGTASQIKLLKRQTMLNLLLSVYKQTYLGLQADIINNELVSTTSPPESGASTPANVDLGTATGSRTTAVPSNSLFSISSSTSAAGGNSGFIVGPSGTSSSPAHGFSVSAYSGSVGGSGGVVIVQGSGSSANYAAGLVYTKIVISK